MLGVFQAVPPLGCSWRGWGAPGEDLSILSRGDLLGVSLAQVFEGPFLKCSWRGSVDICLELVFWSAPGEDVSKFAKGSLLRVRLATICRHLHEWR